MKEPKSLAARSLVFAVASAMAVQAVAASGESPTTLPTGGTIGETFSETQSQATISRATAVDAVVEGQVVGQARPVAEATVYAYEVATYALEKVLTDGRGRFLFNALPAGMYKLIAYKEGFTPTIALLLRRRSEEDQFVEIQLREEEARDVRQAEGYWDAYRQVPVDVLRDIRQLWVREERGLVPGTRVAGVTGFEGAMIAQGGVEQLGAAYGEAQVTGAEVDLQGKVGAMQVGINGHYKSLLPSSVDGHDPAPDAEVRAVAVALESPGESKFRVATSSGELASVQGGDMAPVALEHYQMQWTGPTGARGRSDVSAQYVEEANYHRAGWVDPIMIPEASRTWQLKGSYDGELTARTHLKAGLRYQQRQGQDTYLASLFEGQATDPLSHETLGVYGTAGSQILPRVLVEYGLYSSVRDGSLSLMPHGGMVVDLGADWKARTSFARRVESREPESPYQGFSTAFYSDTNACRDAGEACYQVFFSRGEEDDSISVGAVHREFAETLRLYFSPDFFDRLESLFVVQGDQLPELQFSMVRRIAPKVLARLESNIAAGGGGIFYATDAQLYENQVRYLVTSLDTRFQQTSTGVFVAFHHLEQELSSVQDQARNNEIEMQRLQLMLTQDLNVLADFASNWAVRFNVELSRGSTPYQLSADDDELHKKLTGGFSVSF